jgi:hypothetical protein
LSSVNERGARIVNSQFHNAFRRCRSTRKSTGGVIYSNFVRKEFKPVGMCAAKTDLSLLQTSRRSSEKFPINLNRP